MNLKIFLIVVVSFLILPPVSGEDAFPFYFTEQAEISIDGLREDWPDTVPFFLNSQSMYFNIPSEKHGIFHGRIHCFFDARNIYLYGEVSDPDPFRNDYRLNSIYKGDAVEVYLGLHEERGSGKYGKKDFQFGIAFHRDSQSSVVWNVTPQRELSGVEIKAEPQEKGYRFEAMVPLNNFWEDLLIPGNSIWMNFSFNNQTFSELPETVIWNGDNHSWATPANWLKGKLVRDPSVFRALYVLTPPKWLPGQKNRIALWYKGQPWQGNAVIGERKFKSGSDGTFSVIFEDAGTYDLSLIVEGKKYIRDIKVLRPPAPLSLEAFIPDFLERGFLLFTHLALIFLGVHLYKRQVKSIERK